MVNKLRAVWCMVTGGVLCGCVSIPSYTPEPTEPTARIKLADWQGAKLCTLPENGKRGKTYRLSPTKESNGYVPIPANRRIALSQGTSWESGKMYYSCQTRISFVPQAKLSYYLNFEIRNDRCYIEVHREDPKSPVGLSFEPTISPVDAVLCY